MSRTHRLLWITALLLALTACAPQTIHITLEPAPAAATSAQADGASPQHDAKSTLPDTAATVEEGSAPPDAQPTGQGGYGGEQIPYADLVASAEKASGLFTVYHIAENQWYWEIPSALLGQDLLWYTELTKAPSSFF